METRTHPQKFLKHRKFMLVLPLLVLPFVVLFFVALGGGKGSAELSEPGQAHGMNTLLPDAHFKNQKDKDKLGIYEDAGKDSARYAEALKNDPYYKYEPHLDDSMKQRTKALENILRNSASRYSLPGYSGLKTATTNLPADANEKQLILKMQQLKNVIANKSNAADNLSNSSATYSNYGNWKNGSPANPDIRKLETLMQMVNGKPDGADSEVSQLSTMLDKVMLVQHPEKIQDSMKRISEKNKTNTFVVSTAAPENNITLMDTMDEQIQTTNAFYGLNDDGNSHVERQIAIEAIIPETETLVSGATVKLRLLNDIFVNGIKIAKDELVYGTASLSNERLRILIASLRFHDNIFPVSLSVYDLDGMEGIYIPGSISRDVSKQSADEAISSIGLNPIDQSMGAQATVAGIAAAKTLASRKIKLIRVNIKSGYRVLLKDNNQKN